MSIARQEAKTRDLIAAGANVIYEADFAFDGIFVKVDVLARQGTAWEIHEVKMSTSGKGVLRDLAAAFPDLAEAPEVRIANIRDLMLPLKKRHVYRWQMRGSHSIKEVLPALVPDLSYDGLDIAGGGMAMLAYHEMCAADDPERVTQIRRGLLAYCRLDTWAMVRVLGSLKAALQQSGQQA